MDTWKEIADDRLKFAGQLRERIQKLEDLLRPLEFYTHEHEGGYEVNQHCYFCGGRMKFKEGGKPPATITHIETCRLKAIVSL